MSMMKRFAESVAEEMGKDELDEEVLAEAQRRLDTMLGVDLPKDHFRDPREEK